MSVNEHRNPPADKKFESVSPHSKLCMHLCICLLAPLSVVVLVKCWPLPTINPNKSTSSIARSYLERSHAQCRGTKTKPQHSCNRSINSLTLTLTCVFLSPIYSINTARVHRPPLPHLCLWRRRPYLGQFPASCPNGTQGNKFLWL